MINASEHQDKGTRKITSIPNLEPISNSEKIQETHIKINNKEEEKHQGKTI